MAGARTATDAAGGVISRKDFTAFGEEVVTAQRVSGTSGNGYDPPNVRQDYTGYQKDLESGLEFAQARYYNTRHGRFTSVDPLAGSLRTFDPQTFNRYSYVMNKPTAMVDPSGAIGCSAQNSYAMCGGEGGGGDEQAEFNRFYGGLSNNIARGMIRRDSIDRNSYDPELNIFHNPVTVEFTTGIAGSGISGGSVTLERPTLEDVEAEVGWAIGNIFTAQMKEINAARRSQALLAVNAAGMGSMTGNLTPVEGKDGNLREGFTFSITDPKKKADFRDFLAANFDPAGGGIFFGAHKGDVGGCKAGSSCKDYRSSMAGLGVMQVVFDSRSGLGYLDMDRFNVYRGIRGFLGHTFLEVLAPKGYGIAAKGTDVTELRRMRDRTIR